MDPPYGFSELQLEGPYALWHYTHRLVPERGGARIVDTVRYALPYGILGRAVHAVAVRREVEGIFYYRSGTTPALLERMKEELRNSA